IQAAPVAPMASQVVWSQLPPQLPGEPMLGLKATHEQQSPAISQSSSVLQVKPSEGAVQAFPPSSPPLSSALAASPSPSLASSLPPSGVPLVPVPVPAARCSGSHAPRATRAPEAKAKDRARAPSSRREK